MCDGNQFNVFYLGNGDLFLSDFFKSMWFIGRKEEMYQKARKLESFPAVLNIGAVLALQGHFIFC